MSETRKDEATDILLLGLVEWLRVNHADAAARYTPAIHAALRSLAAPAVDGDAVREALVRVLEYSDIKGKAPWAAMYDLCGALGIPSSSLHTEIADALLSRSRPEAAPESEARVLTAALEACALERGISGQALGDAGDDADAEQWVLNVVKLIAEAAPGGETADDALYKLRRAINGLRVSEATPEGEVSWADEIEGRLDAYLSSRTTQPAAETPRGEPVAVVEDGFEKFQERMRWHYRNAPECQEARKHSFSKQQDTAFALTMREYAAPRVTEGSEPTDAQEVADVALRSVELYLGSDAFAASFQTLGQYRSAIRAKIAALRAALSAEPGGWTGYAPSTEQAVEDAKKWDRELGNSKREP